MTRSSEIGLEAGSAVAREGEHPSPRQLTRYALRGLAAPEAERLRDHLALCGACSQLVLDLEALEEPEIDLATAEAESWSERQHTVWEALQGALPEEDRALSAEDNVSEQDTALFVRDTVSTSQRVARSSTSHFSYPALAAIVLLSVALGSFLTTLLQGRDRARSVPDSTVVSAGLVAPQLFVPAVDLFPPGFSRSATPSTLHVPVGAEVFTVNLHLDDAGHYADYRLRLLDRDGRERWAGDGLQRTASGSFSVALSPRLLPAGLFRLEVLGLGGGPAKKLEHFDLEVRYQ